MKKAIAYYRVSTGRQGISGLGLEAQRKSVCEYAATYDLILCDEFIEIESGRNNKRPLLKQALKKCSNEKAVLIIAKLDRLGRNVAFISSLIETKVEFVAVDNPNANTFFLHIMAAVAQYESEQTSSRTKAALAATKARGTKLGEYGTNVLSKINKQSADDFALKINPVLEHLKKQGSTSIRKLVKALNQQKIRTYTGTARWHTRTVYSLLQRIEKLTSI